LINELHGQHPIMSKQNTHILIVDDDQEIIESLAKYLSKHGFIVSTVGDGSAMRKVLQREMIDLVILDIMMPGEDGLSICKKMQQKKQIPIPIILLTALNEDADRIIGLEFGADDYITKPFNPRELIARIKSVIRRSEMLPRRQKQLAGTVRFDNWCFDLLQKELINDDDVVIKLSSGEHLLLISLIEYAGVSLTRDQLLDLTKGRGSQLYDRSIDNQISRLRRKLEKDPKNPKIILTKWGGGYVFAAQLK